MKKYRIIIIPGGAVVWEGNSLREARTELLTRPGGRIQRRKRGNWVSVL